jgi:hypothetical protein
MYINRTYAKVKKITKTSLSQKFWWMMNAYVLKVDINIIENGSKSQFPNTHFLVSKSDCGPFQPTSHQYMPYTVSRMYFQWKDWKRAHTSTYVFVSLEHFIKKVCSTLLYYILICLFTISFFLMVYDSISHRSTLNSKKIHLLQLLWLRYEKPHPIISVEMLAPWIWCFW